MKCTSGKHEWTDPADAAKCCNGWVRRLWVDTVDGVPVYAHYWSRDEGPQPVTTEDLDYLLRRLAE